MWEIHGYPQVHKLTQFQATMKEATTTNKTHSGQIKIAGGAKLKQREETDQAVFSSCLLFVSLLRCSPVDSVQNLLHNCNTCSFEDGGLAKVILYVRHHQPHGLALI